MAEGEICPAEARPARRGGGDRLEEGLELAGIS
jgi:hypothetical protein